MMGFYSGNARFSDADLLVRQKQIKELSEALAVAYRSDATEAGETYAKTVEAVAKAACGE